VNHQLLQEENRRNCYDDGYEDGKNNPFDLEIKDVAIMAGPITMDS
jgi:hypothetical protein